MKRPLRTIGLAAALCLQTLSTLVLAGEIMIHDGWARASLGNAPNSTAYMTLMAHGDAADRLIAVSTPLAERAELHGHVMDGDIARMRPVEAIGIAPEEPAVLEPGGLHVMLMGLTDKLEEGGALPLTLTFENAGEITVDLPILGLKASRERQGKQKHDH
ncbi:MAG: copper chaperone PCu(A)C [Geminicoccaceae bacterium]